jgi:RHS repeat-associated protein
VRVSVRNAGSIVDFEDQATVTMTITSGSGQLSAPGATGRFAARFASWHNRHFDDDSARLSFVASLPRLATNTAAGDPRRYSFYSPQLSLLSETDYTASSTPAVTNDYIWFNGQPVAQVDVTTSTTHWTFNDHLGTPLIQTDATGAIDWRAEHEPYGTVSALRAGTARHQPLRFPGQEYDELTSDREYNIFRWYREGWGRYTQSDPIGLSGGLNLFAYVVNNPVTMADPTGLVCGIDVWTEDVTYSAQAGFAGAYKNTWGHKWITWPSSSAGFWPTKTPTGPFQGVPGRVQIPDPNTKAKGNYVKHDTYFDVFKTCQKCTQVVQCVTAAAQQLQALPPAYCLASNNCKDFVADIMAKCGLTETSTFDQMEGMK